MRRLLLLGLVLSLVACTAVPTEPTAPVASVARPIAGLNFDRPTAEDVRAMEANGWTGNLLMSFRPSFYGGGPPAPRLECGNYSLYSDFPSPFGAPWGVRMALTARVAPPGDASLEAYAAATMRPMVALWAADGALFTDYEWVPDLAKLRAGIPQSRDPEATASEAAIVKNVGWPVAYLSPSRHEALFFYKAGVALWVQWAEPRYTEATVPVSKAAAIETVVAALSDPAATCQEATTGVDHFLEIPYDGVFPKVVDTREELVPTYDLPADMPWYAELASRFVDKPVWHVGSNWGGRGEVDALTGTLIRFSRLRAGHSHGAPPTPYVPQEP